MDRIKACEEKFAALFGGKPNSGEGNDPELMQILQRLIFGEISYTGPLDDRMRELITCVVLSTCQCLPQLKAHTAAALNAGVSPLELREAIYSCMPFIGCPRTLNAVSAMDGALSARGIALPLEGASRVSEDERLAEGRRIQEAIYGTEIRDEFASLPRPFDQELPDVLSGWLFGDFYTRGVLDGRTRELLSLVVLAALGADRQLPAHVSGCLKSGCTAEEVYTALLHALPYMGFPLGVNAIRAARSVISPDG
mgnify:CR=1 FL=1